METFSQFIEHETIKYIVNGIHSKTVDIVSMVYKNKRGIKMNTITSNQWKLNTCDIFAYKSSRKNSKIISDVTMRHLITHNENGACDETTIINYFVGIISQLVTDIRYSANRYIEITTYVSINHLTTYVNANNELYSHNHSIKINNKRVKFSSVEEMINYLYDILLLVYPYTRIDISDIYNNASIKYYINLYYHG